MTNERAKADMAELLDELQEQLSMTARMQRQRAEIVGWATARGKRVSATTNADGHLINVSFGANIGDLTYAEIARALTEAAQQAAADASRRGQEVLAPLRDRQSRRLTWSDLIPEMPGLRAELPEPPPVSTAPPNAPERQTPTADPDSETYNPTNRSVFDSSW